MDWEWRRRGKKRRTDKGGREELQVLVVRKVRADQGVTGRVRVQGGHVGGGHGVEDAQGQDGVGHMHGAGRGRGQAEVEHWKRWVGGWVGWVGV